MTNDQQTQAMNVLSCGVQGQQICSNQSAVNTEVNTIGNCQSVSAGSGPTLLYPTNSCGTLWGYWQNQYYPYVIRESYPIYIQEKAMDKGKHAFELLKALMDKGLVKVDKVKDFIEAMDTILKTL